MEIISFLIGYLFGSFPTAFLLLKKVMNLDITKVGSGNVGGRNTYEVSGKLYLGVIVGLFDAVKGLIPVLIYIKFYNDFYFAGFVFVGAVLGHCYSIWIGFKGGRGLGTAAGGFLILMWPIILFWLVGYAIVGKLTRSVHVSIVGAVLCAIIFTFVANQFNLVEKNYLFISTSLNEMGIFFLAVGFVVISTCIKPIIEFVKTGHAI